MLITKISGILLFIVFCCYSCNNNKSYTKDKSGIEYKFIIKNSQKKLTEIGNVIIIDLKYYYKDSLIFDMNKVNKEGKIKINNPTHKGGCLEDALCMMSTGDSAHFLISTESFYKYTRKIKIPDFIQKDEKLTFKIRLKKIFSDIEALEEKAKHYYKLHEKENEILNEYLESEEINVKPTKTGLYIINLKKGTGIKAKINNTVAVHYKVTLINGKIIDSSIKRGEVLKFILGKNDLFLLWDEVVQDMRTGDKIKVITDSGNAYGRIGSGNLVPPYSSLIFEIKLIDIKK